MLLDVDPADLARALGRPVSSYTAEPIDPHLRLHSITGGVFRVRADDGATCVVKVVQHRADDTNALWTGGAEVAHRNYWKREWLAFDSGLLEAMPGRLRAPRTLLTTQRGDDECWIWMEDVVGRHARTLRLDDYSTIAHALGTTQGAYAAGRAPLPDQPWLSRDWLRGWVAACTPMVATLGDDDVWRDERLAPLASLRPRITALWDARDELLAITESAPPTLGHWDFWPSNLYVRDDDTAVAIDWSQVGIARVAQDLDQIILDTVWMQVRPDESLDTLEERVLPAYLRGLHDAGCDVSAGDLRRWYAAAASARYAWLAGLQPEVLADPEVRGQQEGRYGVGYDAVLPHKIRVIERAVALGEWALGSGL